MLVPFVWAGVAAVRAGDWVVVRSFLTTLEGEPAALL